jgi:hypothetical protein
MLLWLLGAMLLTVGCRSLFSSSQTTTVSRWNSYNDVEAAFDKITPYQTTVKDLRKLGFDPRVSPNVKILTYVDIIQTFMPNPAIRRQDLPEAVRECIKAKDKSRAYLVELEDIQNKRHGNLFLDIFGFDRKTHVSGWRFKGLILINGDVVVYKLSSGEPRVAREEKQVKPLGPLQELDGLVEHTAVNANY